MTERTDFFSQAYYTIARAIAEAGVNVDLFKNPQTIAKSVNRRVRVELKRLAVLLRRLIFLEALQMNLAPLPPRVGSGLLPNLRHVLPGRSLVMLIGQLDRAGCPRPD